MKIALLVVASLCGQADEPPPKPEVTLQKLQDKATVRFKDEQAIISVESPSGIGRAEIKPAGGKWPKRIALSLRLKDLEGFYAEHDGLRIQTSLKHEKPEVSVPASGAERKAIPAEERHRIAIKRVGDHIEVELPTVLFSEGVKSIRLQWIDYYR